MFSRLRSFQQELQKEIKTWRNFLRFIHVEWRDCRRKYGHLYAQVVAFDLRLQWMLDNWDGLWQFFSQG